MADCKILLVNALTTWRPILTAISSSISPCDRSEVQNNNECSTWTYELSPQHFQLVPALFHIHQRVEIRCRSCKNNSKCKHHLRSLPKCEF